jgi:COP9 signalosome complex subunit 6
MASAEESGSLVRIHPLVIMSVADHSTRDRLQVGRKRVFGALFGVQTGRVVEIFESFELPHTEEKGINTLKMDTFDEDMALFKENYPNYECLGWYATGPQVQPGDAEIHHMMISYNEAPLFMLLDDNAPADAKELPIQILQETISVVENKAVTEFISCAYEVSPDEAERITAVHCAKVITGETVGSVVTNHYETLGKAIEVLNTRVGVLVQILKDVEAGKMNMDHKLLRNIKALVQRLPVMSSSEFKSDLLSEYNDDLLVVYLASITKGTHLASEVVDKFQYVDRKGRGGHSAGGMMMGF